MIDIHSHILPNIDDGARNIDETMKLLKEAMSVGFKDIVSTSHYMEGYYETAIPERKILMEAIYQKFPEYNMDINLYLGNEVYLSNNIMNLLENRKVSSINDTNYVLFDMPLDVEPSNLYDVVYELVQNKLVPILAHPEKYKFIQKEPELINDLIELGVLMQVNYGSLIGLDGDKARIIVEKMLESNMVHFLGSDAHRPNTIYPKIPKILPIIETMIGKEKLEELTDINPRLVLQNKRIEIKDANNIELTFKEKLMLKLKRR